MKTLNYTNLFLSAVAVLALSACGGSSSNSSTTKAPSVNETAIDKIEAYATNGQETPIAQDYVNAGVSGVTADNINKVNELIVGKTATEVDTTPEIQALVDSTVPVVISHNGVNYSVVVSPISGRTWLDRNVGASQKCNTPYDRACFGDYYQWGRNTDGHQKLNSKTTEEKGKTITDSGNKFVLGYDDWTSDIHRGDNWKATDGRSVCPVGFRVPSVEEFQVDTSNITDKKTQSENFLKLPYAGIRDYYNANLDDRGDSSYFWMNSPEPHTTYADSINSHGSDFYHDTRLRNSGMSIRCIKN